MLIVGSGTYRSISVPFFAMACTCGAVFSDPITDSSETTSQNCTVSLHESAMSAMEIGSVNASFVEDFENSAIHRNRGKTCEERNGDGNYAEGDSKKTIQMTNRSKSPHLILVQSCKKQRRSYSSLITCKITVIDHIVLRYLLNLLSTNERPQLMTIIRNLVHILT